ncbi:MAG TPA: 4-hydroxyphenylacetate 3-hydroxylase N-terminal domain-containing protein [Streptosporangiaceae bacterium]|jgi:aromatic ring hydroxylase
MRDGQQYLSDLRDKRYVTVDGSAVADVTRHPGMRGIAGTVAGVMDLHYGPGSAELLTTCPETGEVIPWSYALAADAAGVRSRGRYYTTIARATGGLLGRSPDFLATLLASWYASADVFGYRDKRYTANVVAHYRRARQDNLCHTHAISDPPGDRRADGRATASALRKTGETGDGIVVRGVKMLATFAPLADELLVYPFRPLGPQEEAQAMAFSIPIGTPGLALLCRRPLARGDSAAVAPLRERFDELDALCVFDDVLVPHERVFIDGDVELCNSLRQRTQMTSYLWHQSTIRVAVKAELMLGAATLVARATGRDGQAGIRSMLGEMAAKAEALHSLVAAAEAAAGPGPGGHYVAAWSPLAAAGVLGTEFFPRLTELLQLAGSSNLVMQPGEQDLAGPAAEIFRSYLGSGAAANGGDDLGGEPAEVLRLAAELAIGDFGGRQLLFERFYLGAPEALRDRYFQGTDTGPAEELVRGLLRPARAGESPQADQ